MYRSYKVTAVIAAAGKGSRMKSPTNKQFLVLKDKPVLAHTLAAFQKCELVDAVVVVSGREDIAHCRENIVSKFSLTKVTDVLPGGPTRQQSVSRGLEAVEDGIVIIHDGARPIIHPGLIEEGIELLLEQGLDGTACAVPVKDTVKMVGRGEVVERTLEREKLRAVQTPQCFLCEAIKEVHRRAAREGIEATDDLALLENYGYSAKLYGGRYDNIKITTPEDLLLAGILMEGRS